eukprot:7847552-Pyramimonas_sp.AAC.1
MSKQEIIPVLSGPGSGTDARELRMERVSLPAPHSTHARYLGGRIGANCSYAVEFTYRKKA